jgi:hypothetical protein
MPQPLHGSVALQHPLEQGISQEEGCCTAQHQGSHMEAMDVDQACGGALGHTHDSRPHSSCHTTPTSSSQLPAATQQALGSSPEHSAEATAAVGPMLGGSSRRHGPGWRKKAHPYRAPMDLGEPPPPPAGSQQQQCMHGSHCYSSMSVHAACFLPTPQWFACLDGMATSWRVVAQLTPSW